MALLDELEASLRAKWDRDTLAVYADELQNRGELRGELIVIDLRIEEAGPLPELVERRKALLGQWLATLPPGKVQHGFLDLDATGPDPVEQVTVGLASPAARYVRTAAIAGHALKVREAVRQLSAEQHPGLSRLVLRQWSANVTSIDATLVRELFDALPDLEMLELDGYSICADAVHPHVRRMRVSGYTAIASLYDQPGPPWPALAELDFAFGSHIDGGNLKVTREMFRDDRLPALVTLDLSRNKPGCHEPDMLGLDVDIAAFAARLPFRKRVAIRLPTPPEPATTASSRRPKRRAPR